jgi:hypothetical protein
VIDDLCSAKILKLAANMPRAGRLPAPQGMVALEAACDAARSALARTTSADAA